MQRRRQVVSVLAEMQKLKAVQDGVTPDEGVITRLERRAAKIFRGLRITQMLDPQVQALAISRAKVTR